ncbi:HAD-IIA family hydrolase [Brevibacillus dissolubilis]|uniref:HAD-IIA family hydrolase n=1 Tax=Brevibacillus dissolubilis TaxID=1844116 RepID=UPI0011179E5D|nr:HAD-IIA family hydrolase [Brevibacillus dissolubilis]
MKRYTAYLLDLDGTIYRGSEVIPEAVTFIEKLREARITFLYLTNNSSTTPEKVAERLTGMGLPTTPEEVVTTAMATAYYLSEQEKVREGSGEGAATGNSGADAQGEYAAGTGNRGVYIIGEEGLHVALTEAGFTHTEENPAYVVVGIDRAFNYEKLAAANRAIRSGATYIATNIDPALPTEKGLMPGNGSLVAAVATASVTKPVVIGKPEKIIVDYALAKLNRSAEETLIVGDNLFTDIEAGVNSGMDSLLVLTGFSSREDAEAHHAKPTYIEETLMTWWDKQESL